MNSTDLQTVIDGNQQAISQCQSLLTRLTDEQYCRVCEPFTQSSIGQHIRHVLDVYRALLGALASAGRFADYDQRRRGAAVESNKTLAIDEFADINKQLKEVDLSCIERPITMQTEVCLESSASIILTSSLIRELVFTASHAVHHFALIAVIARFQDVEVDPRLGVAPATASFLRACDTDTAPVATRAKAV